VRKSAGFPFPSLAAREETIIQREAAVLPRLSGFPGEAVSIFRTRPFGESIMHIKNTALTAYIGDAREQLRDAAELSLVSISLHIARMQYVNYVLLLTRKIRHDPKQGVQDKQNKEKAS
jgi:hypothetical protein